jgi:hypothetical protein
LLISSAAVRPRDKSVVGSGNFSLVAKATVWLLDVSSSTAVRQFLAVSFFLLLMATAAMLFLSFFFLIYRKHNTFNNQADDPFFLSFLFTLRFAAFVLVSGINVGPNTYNNYRPGHCNM